jgi:predicted lipid-binding transport protein (Tim44 family)
MGLLLALALCASLFLPAAAQARAGFSHGGFHLSIGSRGARTREPGIGQPLTHSHTHAPAPAFGAGGGLRHPFVAGLFGGFLGSYLFGHGGLFGLVIILAVVLAVLLAARGRQVSRGRAATATLFSGPMLAPRRMAAPDRGRDIALPDADLDAFQKLHAAIQDAWSHADLARLSQLATPEMLRWFSGELSRNAAAGVRNIVSGVALVKGELTESWEERDRQYATALMRWRALDYSVRLGRSAGDPDLVVSGDPRVPVEAEEVWTFVRGRGGPWRLSAIQQV